MLFCCVLIIPANSYSRSEDNNLWSEDESPDDAANNPIPAGEIWPKAPFVVRIGVSTHCHKAVVEICRRNGVDECCQNPGQELEGRQLSGTSFVKGGAYYIH